MKPRIAVVALALLTLSNPLTLLADTLVLTNGRRIQGELIGVAGREIEFAERRGNGRRTVRIPRQDIARIEFEDGDVGNQGRFGGGNGAGDPFDPRGMRERSINVTARQPWTDTGIDVRAGQSVYFVASGETRWGPNRRDDAAGERNSPVNVQRPIPDRPAAALIGRVGNREDHFFIGGESGPLRVRSSGRLYLGINDDVFTDNTGTLRVIVYY